MTIRKLLFRYSKKYLFLVSEGQNRKNEFNTLNQKRHKTIVTMSNKLTPPTLIANCEISKILSIKFSTPSLGYFTCILFRVYTNSIRKSVEVQVGQTQMKHWTGEVSGPGHTWVWHSLPCLMCDCESLECDPDCTVHQTS